MVHEKRGKDARASNFRASAASEKQLQDISEEEGYPDPRGTTQVYFYKYQGLGNDFIMVDNRHCPDPIFSSKEAEALCDRR